MAHIMTPTRAPVAPKKIPHIAGVATLPFWLKRDLMVGDGADCFAWEPNAEFVQHQYKLEEYRRKTEGGVTP